MGSPSTPLSPLSPKMGSFPSTLSSKLRNRVPTQLRRCLPLYVVCMVFFFLVLNADVFAVSRSNSISRRNQFQKPLGGYVQADAHLAGFPKKIWQTWKIDPLNFDKRDLETAKSWTTKNPGFRYEVLTDNNDVSYVEQAYGPDGFNRVDIVDMYRSINATIIKADLLRYLIMYAEGGVYADIDVEALKPVHRFVPERYNADDIDMVIGIEIDQPQFRDHPILGQKSMSFCQWTFMCKPRLPVMLRLVENIMAWLSDIARKQGVPISEVVLDFDEVISGTGPSAFTIAVLEDMNSRSESREKITWEKFHELDESKLVSRVLVLDVESFAAGQGHSDSGNHNARGALVKHHYHASNWPSRHPRFSHPVYGEVERCNWNAECVRKWDEDTATYKTLSPQEQQVKIEEAKAEQARKMEEARLAAEQALKLEQLGQAVRKAEEEAKKAAADELKAKNAGGAAQVAQVAPNAEEKPVFKFPVPGSSLHQQPPPAPLAPAAPNPELPAPQAAEQKPGPLGPL